ncbi:PBP1A family penicillin-binding protein [Desulfococcaceae bacterium HSG8]|nr:PBP1A family penicillin-binding protein [Desulfococcaceae bacterium HSG8]
MRKNRHISKASEKKTDSNAKGKKTDSKAKEKKSKARKIIRVLIWTAFFMMICLIAGTIALYVLYSRINEGLPRISSLKTYRPATITTVHSDDDRKIGEFYEQRRIVIPMSEMPKSLISAFVAAEDSRFFEHKGVDIPSIIRAFLKNMEAGTVVQGGSTITQQVIKYFLLTPEKSYERKLKEAILAYRIDKAFSKEEILYLYLNQIYLGHGAYGVEAAAENYFGKPVEELNVAECAILAGLPKAPGRDSPFRHPERARKRQLYVLKRMVDEGYITEAQEKKAINTKLDIKPRRNWYMEKVPFYTEHVRRYVEDEYGRDALYRDGLKIYTAVNIEMQKAAREAVDKGLRAYDKRHGYRGPVKRLKPEETEAFLDELRKEYNESEFSEGNILKGLVVKKGKTVTVNMGNAQGTISPGNMRWARRSKIRVGDVVMVKIKRKAKDGEAWNLALEQTPAAQGALVCIEAGTGHVKAMMGGRDFRETQFNRAIQSRRQPGSSFKPIVYAAAIDRGYTPATEIIDNAFVRKEYKKTWKPQNYGKKFYGPILLRKAITKSRNLATIQILDDIGVDYTIKYARKLGITSDLYGDLSLALGASGVSLLEIVKAYSVFTNLGKLAEPVFITKIVDRDGNVLEDMNVEKKQAIEGSTAYIMTSLLESVIKHGTGARARALGRPAAGKTGTTNDQHDAWFVGYTPDYISGAWVGFDKERSLGRKETGGKAALPIWLDFMKKVHEDKPEKVFKVPRGVVFSNIDAETGLLPVPETKRTIFECFKEGTVPKKYTRRSDSVSDTEQFFKSDL